MNKNTRNGLVILGVLVAAALIFYAGFYASGNQGYNSWSNMMRNGYSGGYGSGMMGEGYGGGYGGGMMDGSYDRRGSGFQYGMGMMGGGMMSGFSGMTGGYGRSQAEPLSLAEAQDAVENYLAELDIDDLAVAEVMIFENHAYAQIAEETTGMGAMEVLVDPVSKTVYPEHGPNMMWNLKYSAMGEYGMMSGGMMGGGMMGGYSGDYTPQVYEDISAEMSVSPEEAIGLANEYLDEVLPGYEVADEVDAFYGYYTLHVLEDGVVSGMLSVNGFNGQVFVHAWHGDFIEMSGE